MTYAISPVEVQRKCRKSVVLHGICEIRWIGGSSRPRWTTPQSASVFFDLSFEDGDPSQGSIVFTTELEASRAVALGRIIRSKKTARPAAIKGLDVRLGKISARVRVNDYQQSLLFAPTHCKLGNSQEKRTQATPTRRAARRYRECRVPHGLDGLAGAVRTERGPNRRISLIRPLRTLLASETLTSLRTDDR